MISLRGRSWFASVSEDERRAVAERRQRALARFVTDPATNVEGLLRELAEADGHDVHAEESLTA